MNENNENMSACMDISDNPVPAQNLLVHVMDTMLEQGTHYMETDSIKAQFGYLYYLGDTGLASMFKITSDLTTTYFRVHDGKVQLLDLTPEEYEAMVGEFLSGHGKAAADDTKD